MPMDRSAAVAPEETVVIALGSNIDPEANLKGALRRLGGWLRLVAVSPVYRTPPWGLTDQPDFLNAVLAAQSGLDSPAILDRLLETESALGRVRTLPNGPRRLDLDLLFHGSRTLDSERLTLPHPRLHERGFVLVPLCDVLPDFHHPRLGATSRELLAQVDRSGIERVPLALDADLAEPHP